MTQFEEEFELLLKIKTPLIEVVTHEWQRLQSLLNTVSSIQMTNWKRWNRSIGIIDAEGNVEPIQDPLMVLRKFKDDNESCHLILENFNFYLQNPDVVNLLFEIVKMKKVLNKTIIIESSELCIPNALSKEMVVLNMPLPNKKFIRKIAESVIINTEMNSKNYEITDELLSSVLGLTTTEVNMAFLKAAEKFGKLDNTVIDYLITEKEHIIKKEGLLEYYRAEESMESVGGLDNLKEWLRVRANAFSIKATEYGIDTPKGVLLLGIPGCGKSLTAKSIAKTWKFPLLRFDLGKVFGGIVVQSESNMRKSLDIATTIAPCVLWIDEIEKGLSGLSSSDRTDGGTASRVFGTLLTWMQEKKEPVFVVATANNIESLPPELLRKGRFDEIFFVDLPSKEERKEIFKIHIKAKKRKIENFNIDLLAEKTSGLTGAEIGSIVSDALFTSFTNGSDLSTDDIIDERNKITPLSTVMSEKITSIRTWAKSRARMAGNEFNEEVHNSGKVVRLKSESYNPLLED
ncbi:MAG: AAA family ATPase [Bacilli bacterium]|nr:AAA family ATPase [Bacilli bacterium]